MNKIIAGVILSNVGGVLDGKTIGVILFAAFITFLLKKMFVGGQSIIESDTSSKRRKGYREYMKIATTYLITVILFAILVIWYEDTLDKPSFLSTTSNVFVITGIPFTYYYDIIGKALDNIEEDDKQ